MGARCRTVGWRAVPRLFALLLLLLAAKTATVMAQARPSNAAAPTARATPLSACHLLTAAWVPALKELGPP
jgi:hypothetical protein